MRFTIDDRILERARDDIARKMTNPCLLTLLLGVLAGMVIGKLVI